MSQEAFHKKWAELQGGGSESNAEEKSIYVEKGEIPRTQRQLSLYHYFLFIRKHLEAIGVKDVLEIGCGRGTIGLYCREYLGLNVSLMDNEEKAIALARDAFAAHGLEAKFLVGDALHMALPDNAFDAVVSIGLAEHLDNVTDLFREQYRVLRPGGVMISLNIPRKFSVQELNLVLRFFKKLFGQYKERIGKDYYRNTFSAAQYEQFARDAGFVKTAVTHVCPFPIYVPIRRSTDRRVTAIRRAILALRGLVMPYPYKTNSLLAHAHFLVGYKAS